MTTQMVNLEIRGIEEGFQIGFECRGEARCLDLRHSNNNMAVQDLKVVDQYIERKVALGRLLPVPL